MKSRCLRDAYQCIHIIFAGIILCIIVYSGIFSSSRGGYPIQSYYKNITGRPTASTGMSRAFSSIVRLDFKAAKQQNPHSLEVFAFFFVQLWLRGLFFLLSTRRIKRTLLITVDATGSVVLFIVCFRGLIASIYI